MKKVLVTLICVMVTACSLFLLSCSSDEPTSESTGGVTSESIGESTDGESSGESTGGDSSVVILEKVEAKDATCEEDGVVAHWKDSATGKLYSDEEGKTEITDPSTVVINKLGHDLVKVDLVEATCENAGNIEYYKCSRCDTYFKDAEGTEKIEDKTSVITAKLGHDFDTENITWTWTDYSSATATFVCKRDGEHKEVVNAVITSEETLAPTCTTTGTKTYTATVTFNDVSYTNTKTEDIAVLGHDFDTENIIWTWTDYSSATATFVCKRDGEHKEVVNAVITSEETLAPTCTATGTKTYTATVTFNDVSYTSTKTETLAMIKHTLTHHAKVEATCEKAGVNEYWTCDVCGKVFSDENGTTEIEMTDTVIPRLAHNFVDGVCTLCKKDVHEINPFDLTTDKITFDGRVSQFKYVYNHFDGTLTDKNAPTFNMTMAEDVVNEFIRLGYTTFTVKIGRKTDSTIDTSYDTKTANRVTAEGKTTNDYVSVPVTLAKDTPVVINGVRVVTNVWDGWLQADGFSVEFVDIAVAANDISSWVSMPNNKYFYKDGRFNVPTAPVATNFTMKFNTGLVAHLKNMAETHPEYVLFVIQSKPMGDYNGVSGVQYKGAWDWSGTSTIEIASMADNLSALTMYYGSGKTGTPSGLSFTISHTRSYEYCAEAWFKPVAGVDCKKVAENTFDLTFDCKSTMTILNINGGVADKLKAMGYNSLKVTIESKPGEHANAAIGKDNAIGYNNDKTKTFEWNISDVGFIKSHYVAFGGGPATGFRIKFEAVK